jgi:hypothetical protein
MVERGLISEEERRQLSQGNGGKTNPGLLEWLMGYEQAFTRLIPTPTRIRRPAEIVCGSHSPWEDWPDEPGVGRVADGISHRVDRIQCLGNAVVPQQAYPFFAAIAEELRKEA